MGGLDCENPVIRSRPDFPFVVAFDPRVFHFQKNMSSLSDLRRNSPLINEHPHENAQKNALVSIVKIS